MKRKLHFTVSSSTNLGLELIYTASLSRKNQAGTIEAFNSTSRYLLDDLLNTKDTVHFEQLID